MATGRLIRLQRNLNAKFVRLRDGGEVAKAISLYRQLLIVERALCARNVVW